MKVGAQKIILYLLFYLCSITAGAQSTNYIDSLKNVVAGQDADTNKLKNLSYISYSYRQFYPDSSIAYGQRALVLSEKLHYDKGIFESQISLCQSLMIAGNYPLELEYCFKALATAKRIGDITSLSVANYMLSECYYNLGDFNTSLVYLREVIPVVSKLYPESMYQMCVNLSKLYESRKQPDSALQYARMAFDGMNNNSCLIQGEYNYLAEFSRITPLLGNAFAGRRVYDSALYYFRMGIPVSSFYYLQADMIDGYNGIAAVYKETGRPDSAIWYSQKVLAEKITNVYPVGIIKAANMLSVIYESNAKPDSALKYARIATDLKDSLFNREKFIAVQHLTNKEQEKEREIEESRIEMQSRYKMYLLLAGLVAFLVIAGILLKNKRQKQLQHMRNSIADDLHDDIGSTLSSISIMSELAKEKSPDAIPLLQSIEENTLMIQENMSDIVWAVNPKNDRFGNVLQRMNQFASDILEAKNIELDFANDNSVISSRLSMGQRKNFYLFFKEVINNAAKYSDAKKVFVRISQKDNHIVMTIRDDGKGFDADTVFNGNGMTTIRKRGTELNASYKITSQVNEGTIVDLKFKIT